MDATELDIQLEELETRVERLRSLYEQYFLGIEKIPPAVPQKDVDRRLYALRREQIRNTARRFKLQTIIQRYNTYQQYWMRIMREIENGTYRRHVLRAERTVGMTDVLTAGERKRLGLPERPSLSTPPPEGESTAPSLANQPMSERPAHAALNSGPPAATPEGVRAQMERDLGRLLGGQVDDELDDLDTKSLFAIGRELDDPLLSSMPPPPNVRKPTAKPIARRSARPIAAPHGSLPPQPPQPPRGSTPNLGDSRPASRQSTEPNAASPSGQPTRRSLRPGRFAAGSGSPAAPGGLRLPASSAVAGRGLPPLPKPGVPRGAPPKIPSSPIIALENKAKPPALPSKPTTSPAGAPERPRPPSREPTASKPNALPSANASGQPASAVGRDSVPRGLPHPSESVAPRASTSPARSAATPKSIRPETARKPTTPPSRPKPPVPSSQGQNRAGSSLSNAPPRRPTDALDRTRVEQLAEKLRDARKQTHESAAVSVDALAKKLQTTAEDLRKKHSGKRVDFDVVIKDGKAIVKPIVR